MLHLRRYVATYFIYFFFFKLQLLQLDIALGHIAILSVFQLIAQTELEMHELPEVCMARNVKTDNNQ